MKIGTIGSGTIVNTFLNAISQIPDVECVAMYTRKKENALDLANKYGINTIYTNIEDLYNDSAIDFIYIASPNSLHYEYASQALKHDKHVICEKPFTSTVKEATSLIEIAKNNNKMLFEAITTIHLPNFQIIKEQIKHIGNIKLVQCNYSQYSSKYNALLRGETPNVFNLAFSGGALADINIYNLHFVSRLFGKPQNVQYIANKHKNGIDTSGAMILKYPDFIANCVGAKDTDSINFALVQGEKGFIHVENGVNGCQKVKLHLGGEITEFNEQTTNNNLYYELLDFKNIFEKSNFDECYELLDYSLEVMKTYENARRSADIIFPADKQ